MKLKLDMTPLVDVVFILLIFFMLTSTMMQREALLLELPKSSTGESLKDVELMEINITNKNELFFGGERVSQTELLKLIRTKLSKDENYQILLRADSKASVSFLVRTMDIAKTAGAKNIALESERLSNGVFAQ